MASRPAFADPTLGGGKLTISGESIPPGTKDVPEGAQFICRHVAFKQGDEIIKGTSSDGLRLWTAILDAPTFVAGKAFAMGVETYFDPGASKFLSFTWEDHVDVEAENG